MRILILLFFTSISVTAFAETTSFSCQFNKVASPTGVKSELFHLDFIVDISKGTAYVLGNNGSSNVEPIQTNMGMTFIERTDGGNIMVTALHYATGQAVHSRSTIFQNGIIPTQYYGFCTVK